MKPPTVVSIDQVANWQLRCLSQNQRRSAKTDIEALPGSGRSDFADLYSVETGIERALIDIAGPADFRCWLSSKRLAGPIVATTPARHPNIRVKIFDSPGDVHEQGLLRATIDFALLHEKLCSGQNAPSAAKSWLPGR